jgi:hypothetical protein
MIKNRIRSLETSHRKIEKQLNDAMAHPAASDEEIAELKKRKLRIKDELTRLQQDGKENN